MRLIVNADDFGFSEDTVVATIECFRAGALTSATIMPSMPAASLAMDFARKHPKFSFGVHLTLVGDGVEKCLTDPKEIPELAESNGVLRNSNKLRLKALLGRIDPEQVAREIRNQLRFVIREGVSISHVDSHGHLHKFGSVLRILKRILPEFGIRRVRSVQDLYLDRPLLSPTYWLGPYWRQRIRRSYVTTDHVFLPSSASHDPWAEALLARCLETGTLELGVHPGRNERWQQLETAQVGVFTTLARKAGHHLISWNDLP